MKIQEDMSLMYLIADVGGTKTNLAVFSSADRPTDWLFEATYSSQSFHSLEHLLNTFLTDHPTQIDAACFCVAGPVLGGKATITNLPWLIETKKLQDLFEIRNVNVINDLTATAQSVPHLTDSDLHKLNHGRAKQGASIAVLAPGTGLGEAYLTWDGKKYRAYPSEGGHADFAATTALQWGMLQYFQEKFGHVSFERVCSGLGIANIYQYLKHSGYAEEPEWLAKKLQQTDDPTPIIVSAAQQAEPNELCRTVLNTFIEILGAEAGNMALKLLAAGGVYLGGGIPPRILPLLKGEKFYYPYRNKGRFEDFLDTVPVYVILNPKAALLGAAYEVIDMLQKAANMTD